MNTTIQLQLINGYFYPVDSISRQTLTDELRLERFPKERFDQLSPRLIVRGYKLAVHDYTPVIPTWNTPQGMKVGGIPFPTGNPCLKCYLNMVCDKDICSRKYRRL